MRSADVRRDVTENFHHEDAEAQRRQRRECKCVTESRSHYPWVIRTYRLLSSVLPFSVAQRLRGEVLSVSCTPMDAPHYQLTFIVRLTHADGGVLSGVVERVRSGEKQRFDSVGRLAQVVAEMAERETTIRSQTEPTR